MKFAICNEIFEGWQLEEAMRFAAQLGYQAIEIAPFTLSNTVGDLMPKERRRIAETAARHGIEISGIHWVLVKPEGLFITHPEPEIRQRTSNYLFDLVDFCADIGGKFMVVGSPKQRQLLPGVSREQGSAWAAETFRAAVKQAENRGIVICLEPLAPTETNFINTAAEAIEIVHHFDTPHFKIILDVKAMSSEGKPIPQIIRESAQHFAYFHANDKNLKGPGFGDIDFHPIADALHEVGYNGFVSVEVFTFEEGPEVIATRSIDYLKKCFQRR